MTDKTPSMTPNEIREWEIKIAEFEGLNTELLGYNVQKGSTFLPFPMTVHYTPEETKELAEACAKRIGGIAIPQTLHPIPEYHKSLPDLMRVLNKFENYLIYKSGKDFHCQISGDKSKIIWEPIQEESIFHAIIRNL